MSLFNILCSVLSRDGWEFIIDEKNEIIRTEICGVNTRFQSFIMVDEEQESLLCNTYINVRIPYTKRIETCEFMNRVNYELAYGNFEMDMDDGKIRYRTYVDLAGAEPSKEQILNFIWNGAQIFDTYYPGLTQLIEGNCTAEEALAMCCIDLDE